MAHGQRMGKGDMKMWRISGARAKLLIGAMAGLTLLIPTVSCSSGAESTESGISAPPDTISDTDNNDSREADAIFGEACRSHPDVYRAGKLDIYTNNQTRVDPDSLEDLKENIVLIDGPDYIDAPFITELPNRTVEQVRESYNASLADDSTSKPYDVYLYGKVPASSDNQDGVLNEGLDACVA